MLQCCERETQRFFHKLSKGVNLFKLLQGTLVVTRVCVEGTAGWGSFGSGGNVDRERCGLREREISRTSGQNPL